MRRHIDEDETPATSRHRSRAADARHGFGSPMGMELTGRGPEPHQQQQHQVQQPSAQYSQDLFEQEDAATREYDSMQALADMESPPQPIFTTSTETESPTPPALAGQGNRQTPPDAGNPTFAAQVGGREAASPPVDTPAVGAVRPPRRRRDSGVTFPQNPASRLFVSPTPSNVSATSSTRNVTTPSFQPNSYASPMAMQALHSPRPPQTGQSSFGSLDPIQMGTPRSGSSVYRPRVSDVTMTPDAARAGKAHGDDSASDSDSSVKEPFSDQVKSLNKLLLSTGKRLGPLAHTSFSPDKDNDDLTQEEADLEDVRRQLQRELSMVDYGILKDSPGSTPSRRSRYEEANHPDDEPSPMRSQFSTPDRNHPVATPQTSSGQKGTKKKSPPERRNVLGSPLNKLISSAEKKIGSDQYLSSPSHSSVNAESSMKPAPPSPLSTSSRKTPPRPTDTPAARKSLDSEKGGPAPDWQQYQRQQQKMERPKRNSPPSYASLSPSSSPEHTVSPQTPSSPKPKTPAETPEPKPVLSPFNFGLGRQQQGSPTTVSHNDSYQSSSSSSGSSAQSSKSLLERLGYRRRQSGGLKDVKEEINIAAGEREEEDNSGYMSSSAAVSTSASEDSGFDDSYDYDDKGEKPLLSPTQTRSERVRKEPISSQAEAIRRLEEQLDSPENAFDIPKKSPQKMRREIAPEAPDTEIKPQAAANPNPQSSSSAPAKTDYTVRTLRAQELLDSLDSLFFPGADGPQKEETESTRSNLLPKMVERSDTVSTLGTASLRYPSDERDYPRENIPQYRKERVPHQHPPISAASMAFPSDERDGFRERQPAKGPLSRSLGSQSSIGSARYPCDEFETVLDNTKSGRRLGSQSSIGSSAYPSDERDNSPKGIDLRKGRKSNVLPSKPGVAIRPTGRHSSEHRAITAETSEDRTPKGKNANWLLQTIGSTSSPSGQTLSPVVHEDDEDPEKGMEIVYSSSGSSPKPLYSEDEGTLIFEPTQAPHSRSEDTDDQGNKEASAWNAAKRRDAARARRRTFCCLVSLFLIGAALFLGIGIGLFDIFDRIPGTPSPTLAPSIPPIPTGMPTVATSAPSLSPKPSSNPTETSEPTIPVPSFSPSIAPSPSPTIFTVSFESIYEIIVRDGFVEDIPQKAYESDLTESMDILLEKVAQNYPSSSGTRRRLAPVVLPSAISRFNDVPCPQPNGRDRCQEVFAYITLQNAKDEWSDFKLVWELGIATGQLQFELDRVNPQSPVEIIDLVEESPSPSPTTILPTDTPTPAPSSSPTEVLTGLPTEFELMTFLASNSFDRGESLMDEESPQHQAYLWLSEDTASRDYTEDRLLQRYALATFYYSTHGDNWFFNNMWLSDSDECFWYSRSSRPPCNREGNLANLELYYNNINGQLPPELGLLSDSLTRIVLRGGPEAETEGTIPSELGLLSKMEIFFIRGNQYTGSIPTELGLWTSLQQFDISINNLTGRIPTELGGLVDLTTMDTSGNSLSGQIPTEIGNWERCQRFTVEDNLLTGPVPSEIGLLRRLQSFHGGSNMFTMLPSELGLLTFLDTLSLYENDLGGTIPSEISRMRRLLLLELSDNALTGPIPSQLGSLLDMRDRIDLSYNRLSGQIPEELGDLDRLRVLELHHNKLSGTIPSEIADLSRVTTIRLDSNDLMGSVPIEVCTTFNRTFPAFHGDCEEFMDGCPCCTSCCVDSVGCECRYLGTPQEFLCFQQKRAV